MSLSTLKLGVFVQNGNRYATWQCPGLGQGSILMQPGETLSNCFYRAMDEKRAEAARLTIEADRYKIFGREAFAPEPAKGGK